MWPLTNQSQDSTVSGYQRIKQWSLKRAWRRAPLRLLQSWRAEAPVLFKLRGESYLLCSVSQLQAMLDVDAHAHLERAPAPHSLVNMIPLTEWLPLLQRFMSVSITPLLEGRDHHSISLLSLTRDPLSWTLAHSLFGVDIRKAHTPRARQVLSLFEAIESTLQLKHARLTSRETSLWHHRSLRKMYRQMGSPSGLLRHLTADQGLRLTYEALEWRAYIVDTLTWLFVYLENLPKVRDDIFVEVTEQLESRSYTPGDLEKTKVLHQISLETLRVAPPHWVTKWGEASALIESERFARDFGDLPQHTQLISAPFLDHYEVAEWPSATSFVPHRFLANAHGAPLPTTFLPFGPGQYGRALLELSMHTIVAVAASILRRGFIKIVDSDDDVITSRSSGEAGLSVEHRSGASFGAPHLEINFEVDERYIHIPSARVSG